MQSADSKRVLADRLGADLYRSNAFRVTGLPVAASDREISRHLERLKVAQRLGVAAPETTALLPLTPAPSLEALVEAAQRLRDPDARLIDLFFWFWLPEEYNEAAFTLLRSGHVI